MKTDQSVYAAAQGREFLRNALDGKSNEYIREFAGLIDDPEVLDLLNYYCGVYEDHGMDFLESRVAELLIRNAATRTTDRAFRDGNVSQLQGMVGLTNHTGDGGDALSRFARALGREGCIALVLGPPGAGKTAFTLDSARIWQGLTGGTIVSNITSWSAVDDVVTSSGELADVMAETSGQVLAVIDEGSQSLTSKGAEQVDSDKFAKDLKYVRKKRSGDRYAKRGSVAIVGHTRRDTAADIRRLASIVAEKPSREDPGRVTLYESDGGKDSLEEIAKFKGVTDTAEDYDEHEASHFKVDGVGDGDDGESIDVDDVRKQEAIATALLAVRPWTDDDGASLREASDLVPFSRTWIGDRVREWKKGEHRDLVDKDGNRVA